MDSITIEQYKVGEIPILTVRKEGTEGCPLVFFIHGFTSDKREGLPLGYELAMKGFYFVAFDATLHGERLDPQLEGVLSGVAGNIYPVDSGLDAYCLMHEIIVQTSIEIELLISHFENDHHADPNRVGLTGFSMGGFVSFYCAANNPRIQAAAPAAGIPAFSSRWEDVVLEASSYEKWFTAMESTTSQTARLTDWMKGIDPFDRLNQFFPKPLLIINGDLDTDSPKKYSVDLYRTLKPVYASHPERLRLRIHDGVGHQFTRTMMEDIIDWFDKYLG